VFDNDVLIDEKFAERFNSLMLDERCVSHLWSNSGGILKLGGTMWNDGYRFADKEINSSQSECHNHFRDSYGSYAWIAHEATFMPMIRILESSNLPFDWVFTEMANLGYIVRNVYPNIFIMDLNHTSVIDPSRAPVGIADRYLKHRWHLRKYRPLYIYSKNFTVVD
jgi:hypothetical protein